MSKILYFFLNLLIIFSFQQMNAGFCDYFAAAICDNFRKVDKNCFRSGRVGSSRVARYIKTNGIKVIINLCDEEENNKIWHSKEKETAASLGVVYIDVPLQPKELPSKKSIIKLTVLLKKYSDTPIWIHCKRGMVRTGLIVALREMLMKNTIKKRAIQQFNGAVIPCFWWTNMKWKHRKMANFLKQWDGSDRLKQKSDEKKRNEHS